eukprot:g8266.t1
MSKPVQVYILLGQSNMLGAGKIKPRRGKAEGSLEHAVKEKKLYPYLVDDAGQWTVRKDVRNVRVMGSGTGGMRVFNNEFLTIKGRSIGPEIGIGHYLGQATEAPVMILKSCIGNRSLGWDLLPPGSRPFEFQEKDRKTGELKTFRYAGYKESPLKWEKGTPPKPIKWYAGMQYDGDIARAKKVLAELDKYYPGAKKYEIAGFFFWQGDKDRYNAGHADRYERNLVHLIQQLRKDFNAPNAKFVCATLGQTKKGATGNEGLILEAQLAVDGKSGRFPKFKGNARLKLLNKIESQLFFGLMPPKEATPLAGSDRKRISDWVGGELRRWNASELDRKRRDPRYGNYVDHDRLFSGTVRAKAFTPARRWLVSPQIFEERVLDVFRLTGRERERFKRSGFYGVTNPFVLPEQSGVRDFDNGTLDGGHVLVMLSNADWISRKQILAARKKSGEKIADANRRDRWFPRTTPPAFETIIQKKTLPTEAELIAAIQTQFDLVLRRKPTEAELKKYVGFTRRAVATGGNTQGLRRMLVAVLLESEFLYRLEFGAGPPDRFGRKTLSPREAADAIAYALGDRGPDPELAEAAAQGRLVSKADYRREVRRLLGSKTLLSGQVDKNLNGKHLRSHSATHPKLVRFFREFFGYPQALKVFKDINRSDGVYHNPGRGTAATPGFLIDEADKLVDYWLEKDQNVFENLLTTEKFFVYDHFDRKTAARTIADWKTVYEKLKDTDWRRNPEKVGQEHRDFLKKYRIEVKRGRRHTTTLTRLMTHLSFTFGNGRTPFPKLPWAHGYVHWYSPIYNLARTPGSGGRYRPEDTFDFQIEQPFKVPNRKGLLTHPAWLIAHSQNTATDPVRRGRWIREKLLAGRVPDVPITVDAQIPEHPAKTLRERLDLVTTKQECWKCHQQMNPLGLAFEMYDDFGRFRTREKLEHPDSLVRKAGSKYGADIYKTRPVVTTGKLHGTGESSLDGEVNDAIELIERLARSKRVRQSIIRHAFRFFLGRNEMLSDSQTLIDAEQAYLESGGSFRAVAGKPPMRFIFIHKGNGLFPSAMVPPTLDRKELQAERRNDAFTLDLTKHKLPEWMSPLAAHQQQMAILQGLSGKMCTTGHHTWQSSLGVYKANERLSSIKWATVDFELAKLFPSPLEHIELACFPSGGGNARGNINGIETGFSARGPQQPNYAFGSPRVAMQELFKSVSSKKSEQVQYQLDRQVLEFVGRSQQGLSRKLNGLEKAKVANYAESIEAIRRRNQKVDRMADVIRKHVPKLDAKYLSDDITTVERQNGHTEILLSALISGLTNVVTFTIDELGTPYTGLIDGNTVNLHDVGHGKNAGQFKAVDVREKVRRQHMTVIDRIVTRLKAVPEAGGTMFDNTTLLYFPDNGETHHSHGTEWPFLVLAGKNTKLNLAGRYIRLPKYGAKGHKTLGNWYTTVLNAYGNAIEHYGDVDTGLVKFGINQMGPIPHVVMLNRNADKSAVALEGLKQEFGSDADVIFVRMDLAKLDSVREAAAEVMQTIPRIDALICNAAIAQVARQEITVDGFESQLGVNHYGHFLLCGLLFDRIEQSNGRIVVVGSNAYKMGLKKIQFEDLNFDRNYTAWNAYAQSKLAQMMFAYELQQRVEAAGQKVLVHGGSGGVGHVALQLAKHFGAEVYATGGGQRQLDLIERLGAKGINYKTESVEQYVARHTDGAGFDLVFDSVGGANLSNSFEAAALNGQIATTVSMCELDLTPAHFKGLSLHVVFMLIPMLHNFRRKDHGAILRNVAQIVETGGLTPVLDDTHYSLEQAGQAHARLESGQAMGKVAKPRYRWFAFRWRFLLLIPLALIVLLAVYAPRQHRQKQTIAALKERGAILRTEPLGLPFVAQLAGKEYDQKITEIYWLDPKIADDDLRLLEGVGTLQKVDLTGSKVEGEGLRHLAGMDDLYILHLGGTRVTDAAMPHIARLPSLGILSLSETKVTDSGLKHLTELKHLERVFLDGTSITDDGLAHIAELSQLKELNLTDAAITDRGLAHLKGLKNLELLKVDGTKVTKAGLADLLKSLPKCVSVAWLVGSGHHAQAMVAEHNGYLTQLPLAWFAADAKWRLNPGYEMKNRRFDRPILPGCVACHGNPVEHRPPTRNRYKRPISNGIGCERCHGPGKSHVDFHNAETKRKAGGAPDPIINPKRLSAARSNDVCLQCHLQGDVVLYQHGADAFSFRPGEKLSAHRLDFLIQTDEPESFGVASHGARMMRSRCFIESGRKLTCIDCHDAHRPVTAISQKVYDSKCITCHKPQACDRPVKKPENKAAGGCVACHMPRRGTREGQHLVFTDHWIRKPAGKPRPDAVAPVLKPNANVKLLSFWADADPYRARLGSAYVALHESMGPQRRSLDKGVALLKTALRQSPNDPQANYWLASAEIARYRSHAAIGRLIELLQIMPDWHRARFRLAVAYHQLKQYPQAIAQYERVIRAAPDWMEPYPLVVRLHLSGGNTDAALRLLKQQLSYREDATAHVSVALARHLKGEPLENCLKSIDAALKLDSRFTIAYTTRAWLLAQAGMRKRAQQSYERALKIDPQNQEAKNGLRALK